MKELLKYFLKRFFPNYYLALASRRSRAHSQKLEREWGCTTLTHKLVQHYGPRVLSGPFQGLEFSSGTFDRHLAPKLLGSFERELSPVWEKVLRRSYAAILNIGCAEGYYAVGLSLYFSEAPIHAFDTDSWARKMVHQMAETNRVNNIRVHGACDVRWLSENLSPHSFILSDCEGCEDVLLRPDLVRNMRYCDLLVELHELQAPGVTERLRRRFGSTHSSMLIAQQNRSFPDVIDLPFLSEAEQHLALNEFRPERQRWLFLDSNEKFNSTTLDGTL
jgi:hypothetical protein